MLIFTLAMERLLILVLILVFSTQSKAITVRDDDYEVTPKSYTYSDSDIGRSDVEYRQEEYYKPLRRADVRAYQFTTEESSQEVDYSPQQQEQDNENYPFTQRGQRQQIARRRTPAKTQHVEQYLKEVTPTTKTVYNQRPGNYLRLNNQPRDRGLKEQAEELQQRGILKQPSIQYVEQSDLQQKSGTHPQIQYVISEQKPLEIQPTNQQPQSVALAAYQNALLAHQKVLETEGQDETSRSSIYVTHSIPKKPVRKILKPTRKNEDREQYAQLQQFELESNEPKVYEQQEPARIMYQAKVEYSNGDARFRPSTIIPNRHEKELKQIRQQLQALTQHQTPTEEPLHQEGKLILQHPQQLAAYQHILSSRPDTIPRPLQLPISPETSYQSPQATLEFKTPPKTEERAVQYQQPTYLKKGPKYLPEPKGLRYQPPTTDEAEEKYQEVNIPGPRQEPLITYEEAIAKLQAEKARQQRLRPQATYQQEEQGTQTLRYTLQYPGESQEVTAPETRYISIEEANKYRTVGSAPASAVSQKHPPQNVNIRYYRNPGRPVVSYTGN